MSDLITNQYQTGMIPMIHLNFSFQNSQGFQLHLGMKTLPTTLFGLICNPAFFFFPSFSLIMMFITLLHPHVPCITVSVFFSSLPFLFFPLLSSSSATQTVSELFLLSCCSLCSRSSETPPTLLPSSPPRLDSKMDMDKYRLPHFYKLMTIFCAFFFLINNFPFQKISVSQSHHSFSFFSYVSSRQKHE